MRPVAITLIYRIYCDSTRHNSSFCNSGHSWGKIAIEAGARALKRAANDGDADEEEDADHDEETISTLRESARNTRRVLQATRRFHPTSGTGERRMLAVCSFLKIKIASIASGILEIWDYVECPTGTGTRT